MSRIGKKYITVPAGVEVSAAGGAITVKGPKGSLQVQYDPRVQFAVADGKVTFTVDDATDRVKRAFWGTTRALVNNMINGVTAGFSKKLEVIGVGYRMDIKTAKEYETAYQKRHDEAIKQGRQSGLSAEQKDKMRNQQLVFAHIIDTIRALSGKVIEFQLGYSHPVFIPIPEDITVTIEKNTLTISGTDRQRVGQFAALIRSKRPPEPYKGKGIKYSDEKIRRKAGKVVKAVGS